jgi:hypothetical protein
MAPAKLGNHLVMQRLAINIFFPVHADGKIPTHANSYNLDLNSIIAAKRHVMSLIQNGRFLKYSTYMCHT